MAGKYVVASCVAVLILLVGPALGVCASSAHSGQALPQGLDVAVQERLFEWQKLVFESRRDGNWEIYLADGDGSNPVRLTNHPADDIQARLNPGCTRIAFVSKRSSDYEIYAMGVDGSGLVQLTHSPGDDLEPLWSPDGTRIAFESKRHGQSEIYVMNADGSNAVRLTSNTSYDGHPSWSPDGGRLVFASNRNGSDGIWIMNADGSGATLYYSVADSHRPMWSPDGTRIAFDADQDQDGDRELWITSLEGMARQVGTAERAATCDRQVRSWSRDGLYLAFTYLCPVDGGLTSDLYAHDLTFHSTVRLGSGGLDARPGWETLDPLPPVSSVEPLPVRSPGPFTVSWSAVDAGPSGIKNYDVQVWDASGGTWTDWQVDTEETSASYPGVGGQLYAFRIRARDRAGNVEAWPAAADVQTRVESCPPVTSIAPLSPHAALSAIVSWSGTEQCGSTIAGYDIQARDLDGGTWTDLLVGTSSTWTRFAGLPGHRYSFRSRATDSAYNVEPWPDEGDASTTFYSWSVSGQATDNAGRPVAGPTVTIMPAASHAESGADGTYAAYALAPAPSFVTSWDRAGYGTLPATSLGGVMPAAVDVVLPPADNAVGDWGFEIGSLAAWQPEGAYLPQIDPAAHTGAWAARLGRPPQGFGPLEVVADLEEGTHGVPAIAVDAQGRVHAVWSDGSEIWHAERRAGVWSAPENISNTPDLSTMARLVVDPLDTLHVAWSDENGGYPDVFYRQRPASGNWGAVENVTQNWDACSLSGLAVDGQGVAHATFGYHSMAYARRGTDGTWSTPSILAQHADLRMLLVAEDEGAVHAVWHDTESLYYARSDGSGSWEPETTLTPETDRGGSPHLVVDALGAVHAVWSQAPLDGSSPPRITYAHMDPGGNWSAREPVSDGSAECGGAQVAVDHATGVVHVVWSQWPAGDIDLLHAWRAADGTWSAPQRLGPPGGDARWHSLAADDEGTATVVWNYENSGLSETLIVSRPRDGVWSAPDPLSTLPYGTWEQRLALDIEGDPHVLWLESGANYMPRFVYRGPETAGSEGRSSISQSITVLGSDSVQTLSFLYRLHGASPEAGTGLCVDLNDGQATTNLLSVNTAHPDWTHAWADLSPWAGQEVRLTLAVEQTTGRPFAWAEVDEVTVGSSHPDLWVAAGSAAAEPGGKATLTLRYGNRGAAPAGGVGLSITLPPELTFVSASLPPASTSPSLSWNLGSVDAGDAQTVDVTVAAASGPASLVPLSWTSAITTGSPELELENNAAQGLVRVSWRRHLPLLSR